MTAEPRDYGFEAQRAAECRLEACRAALDAADYGDAEEKQRYPWPDDLTAPFCGCLTCEVRETLFAAWPFFEASVEDSL